MRDIFAGYYRQNEEDLEKLWKDALIVLDANVLLNLYRYPIVAREDLLALLKNISDRLIVPYQAALEYQRNRLAVISSQKGRFDEVRRVLAETEQKLTSELTKLQLQKRHSFISPDNLFEEVGLALNRFREELSSHESLQADVFDEDPIRTILDDLLKGRIGTVPNQEVLNDIYTEGKLRYEDGRPPGYKDDHKGKGDQSVYYSNGLRIERAFGDLILWKQILEIAAVRHAKSLIFVTDDEKSDWWWIVESKGQKTIGPRPELTEEIKICADVDNFWIYNSDRFMQAAKRYLGFDVNQSSIDKIGEIREETAEQRKTSYGLLAQQAVRRWISNVFKETSIEETNSFPDLIIHREGGSIGCEILAASKRKIALLDPSLLAQHKSISGLSGMMFVFVARSLTSLSGVKAAIEARFSEIPDDVLILVGYLDFSLDPLRPKFISGQIIESEPASSISSETQIEIE